MRVPSRELVRSCRGRPGGGPTSTPPIAILLLIFVLGLLPVFKMSLIVNGVFLGGIIALGAIGLSLIFGILKFANVAHGRLYDHRAYVTFFFVDSFLPLLGLEGQGLGPFTFGYPLLIALPSGPWPEPWRQSHWDSLIYRRLRQRGANAAVLAMVSLGLAIAIRGLVQIIWGVQVLSYPVSPASLSSALLTCVFLLTASSSPSSPSHWC